jgi:hypothetical protein
MSAISNIRYRYLLFRYRKKIWGLNPLIPISEDFWCWHHLSFRYQTNSISDIPKSKTDNSLPNDPIKILWCIIFELYFPLLSNPQQLWPKTSILPLRYEALQILLLDIGYWTKVYSDIRYYGRLCALQSDIGHSDIRLSPILLITDIGLGFPAEFRYA